MWNGLCASSCPRLFSGAAIPELTSVLVFGLLFGFAALAAAAAGAVFARSLREKGTGGRPASVTHLLRRPQARPAPPRLSFRYGSRRDPRRGGRPGRPPGQPRLPGVDGWGSAAELATSGAFFDAALGRLALSLGALALSFLSEEFR